MIDALPKANVLLGDKRLRRRLVPSRRGRARDNPLHSVKGEPKGADPIRPRTLPPAIQDREHVWQAQGLASYPYPLRSLRPHRHVSHLRRRNRHLLAQSMSPELRSLSWWLSFVRSASSRASRSEIRCFFRPISQPFGHSSLSPRYKGRLHCTSILDEAFVLTIVTVKKVSLPCDRRNLIGSGLAADRSGQHLSSWRTRFWRPSRDARVSCAAAKPANEEQRKRAHDRAGDTD